MRQRLLIMLVLVLLPAAVLAQEATDEYSIHVVQRGENLFRIALRYGMTTEELASLNGITNAANIQVGQRLLVPKMTDPSASSEGVAIEAGAAPSGETVVHTVQAGETLFRIALAYDVDVDELALANNISDPTRIFAGQQLVIPNVSVPEFIADLPAAVESVQVMPLIFREGQTGQVRVRTTVPAQLTGMFIDTELQIIRLGEGLRHLIFIGIPVFTEPGIYPLTLTITPDDGEGVTIEGAVQIVGGGYGSEQINLLDGRDVLLTEAVEDAELELLRGAARTFTAERYFDAPMGLPAAAGITSQYGTRRSYNGGAFDRYHSGTDFAGAPGTPIFAPAPGRVVLADSLNVRGNATMLDHGWGIYTGYWHQTEIYVAPGDFVETGQIIGTIGATGRVTGAHLHWELWVNGVAVDPMQWVQQSFIWE